jgi:hypothetical protein
MLLIGGQGPVDPTGAADRECEHDRSGDRSPGQRDRAESSVPRERARRHGRCRHAARRRHAARSSAGGPALGTGGRRALGTGSGGRAGSCSAGQHHDGGCSGGRRHVLVRDRRHRSVWRPAGRGRMQALAAPLQLGDARWMTWDPSALEAFSEGSRIVAYLVHPGRSLHRGQGRGAHARHPADGRPQSMQNLPRIDARVAPDRHDGGRPHQNNLGGRGDLVRHLHRGGADAVIEDDDVGPMHGENASELRGGRSLADHLEALALEDESQESSAFGLAFAHDDTDPLGQYPPSAACRPHPPGPGSTRSVPWHLVVSHVRKSERNGPMSPQT